MEVKHTAQGLYAVNYLQGGHALDTTSPNISGCSSRRKFGSQTSDNMERWKSSQQGEKIRRKKMQVREKVGKSRNTVFFRGFVAPEGWKVGSLKRRVRRHLGRWEMKSCTSLWREAHFEVNMLKNTRGSDHFWKLRCRKSAREAHFEVKMYKTHHSWTTFGSWDVEEVHAVVARRTFPSQNVKNTRGSDHFWKLRCRKSAREAHFEVKMYKTHHSWTTFGSWDVEKVYAVVARSTFRSEHVQNTTCLRHFWRFRCRKSARCCGAKHISKSKCTKHPHVRATLGGSDVEKVHAIVARSTFRIQNVRGSDHFWRFRCRFASLQYITLHSTTLRSTTLHYITQHYNYNYTTTLHYTPLHEITLHYTTLHYTTLHDTTLHYTTLHYLPLHFTTLHYTPLHYNYNYTTTLLITPLQYTPLHSTTLNYTTLHYITLHYTTQHSTTLHYITLHYLPLHFTTLHYTTLHYTTTTTTTTQLHSTTRNYTTLHYTTLHYIPLHSTTLHYTTLHYTEWHCTTDRQVDR